MKCVIPRCMADGDGAFGLCGQVHAALWEVSSEKKRAQHAFMDFVNGQDFLLRNLKWSEGKPLGEDLPGGPVAEIHKHDWGPWARYGSVLIRECKGCELSDHTTLEKLNYSPNIPHTHDWSEWILAKQEQIADGLKVVKTGQYVRYCSICEGEETKNVVENGGSNRLEQEQNGSTLGLQTPGIHSPGSGKPE